MQSKLLAIFILIFSFTIPAHASRKLSSVQVKMPNGEVRQVNFSAAGEYSMSWGDSAESKQVLEFYTPTIVTKDQSGKLISYEFEASEEIKSTLCEVVHNSFVRDEKVNQDPIAMVAKAQPQLVVKRKNGEFIIENSAGNASVAGKVVCQSTKLNENKNPDGKVVATFELVNAEGKMVAAELRSESDTSGNTFHSPRFVADGVSYDIAYESGLDVTICRDARLADRGVESREKLQAQPEWVVSFKRNKYILVQSRGAAKVLEYLSCGGNAGGDGSGR